jgi:site-specific DNA-methyltransferase (adenine-specific)
MRQHIPDNSIDLTVTSPPYDLVDYDDDGNLVTHPGKGLRDYQGYDWDFASVAAELWRVTKPGGVVVWVVADATVNGSETGTSFRQALGFMELGFRLHDTMIYHWHKAPLTHNRYEQCFEYMFVFSNGKPSIFNPLVEPTKHGGKVFSMKSTAVGFSQGASMRKKPDGRDPVVCKNEKIKSNIWSFKAGRTLPNSEKFVYQHPAIFPEALARDHIISWSNPGDIVFDPLCGSGTTLKMAVEQGRQYIGIDISPEYCELSRQRVSMARIPLPGLEPEPKPEMEQLEL